MQRFTGKTIIVTGGAAGIGRACVRRLLAEGAQVLAVDLQTEGLKTLTSEAEESSDRLAILVQDVASDDAPDRILEAASRFGDALCGLVNNAGIGGSHRAALTSDAEFDRFCRVNLRSVFRLSRAALDRLRASGGAIVNISSIYGMTGFPGTTGYAATKAALVGLTSQMAADYGPEGVRINGIAPGLIETDLVRKRLETEDWFRSMMLDATPVGRPGRPEDVAAAVAFLLSEDASFIAGHTLPVDGGWLATRYRPGLTGR